MKWKHLKRDINVAYDKWLKRRGLIDKDHSMSNLIASEVKLAHGRRKHSTKIGEELERLDTYEEAYDNI